MDDSTIPQVSEDTLFHCRSCHATRPCPPGQLHGYIADDASWPRCCGNRMAISFPHGHPELIVRPKS